MSSQAQVPPQSLQSQLDYFVSLAEIFKDDTQSRTLLLQHLHLLKLQLQRPIDSMLDQWIWMNAVAASNFMVETNVFSSMPFEGPITASELSLKVSIEASVIARMMRILVGVGIVEETDEDTFAHTPRSREFLPGHSVDLFKLMLYMQPPLLSLPTYFNKHNPLSQNFNPSILTDALQTPFAHSHNAPGSTFFSILASNPAQQMSYNRAMAQQDSFLPTLGMYPFSSLQAEVKSDPTRPFVVDIGGGRGQMLKLIGEKTYGGWGSRLILQDQKHVLASVPQEELGGIEKIAHDFMHPQPVKDALIYYLRRVLHSYPDAKCVVILKSIAEAMSPSTPARPASRLLIGEYVVAPRVSVGGELTVYTKDMACLTIHGKERTEKEFAALLEEAGLKLVKVWKADGGGEQGVVEAVLSDG